MRLLHVILATALLGLISVPGALGGGSGSDDTCLGKRVTFKGTDGKDEVKPTRIESGDVVSLGEKRDSLRLRNVKNVTVCGGRSSDELHVGKNTGPGIVLAGGRGVDFLGTTPYKDSPDSSVKSLRLIGGPHQDYLYGGPAGDILKGAGGDDVLSGLDGRDRLQGGPGKDSLAGDDGADLLFGGDGNDSLVGGEDAAAPGYPDKADGGKGIDRCQAGIERSCERDF